MAEAHLVAASGVDDAAFQALADLASVLSGESEAGVIGGHMVGILTARFPSPGYVLRRTGDADGGIPAAMASDGSAHERLLVAGYTATGGNRYEKQGRTATDPPRVVDLLVPNLSSRIGEQKLGGRHFDTMPALGMALGATSLIVPVTATLSTGEELHFDVRVPGVEGAIILKAYAWSDRRAQKDAIDLHSLFRIVEHHPAEMTGGWNLSDEPPKGARLDTARTLHALADRWEARPPKVTFDPRQLIVSIRKRVARPTT